MNHIWRLLRSWHLLSLLVLGACKERADSAQTRDSDPHLANDSVPDVDDSRTEVEDTGFGLGYISVHLLVEVAGVHFIGQDGNEDLAWQEGSSGETVVVAGLPPGVWFVQAYEEYLAPEGSQCNRSGEFRVREESSDFWFVDELPGEIDGEYNCRLPEE